MKMRYIYIHFKYDEIQPTCYSQAPPTCYSQAPPTCCSWCKLLPLAGLRAAAITTWVPRT